MQLKTSLVSAILFLLFAYPHVAIAQSVPDVILDPGHSPGKSGALSASGEKEVIFNDELARYVKDFLAKNNIQVELTRHRGEELSLSGRAVKSAGKRLFISLHHDSVQPQFLQKNTKFPTTDKASGYSIFVSRKNPFFEKSLQFARIMGRSLRQAGLAPSTHHGEKIKGENRELLDPELGIYAFDDLVVLKQAKSPAFLFEAGVLPNPRDEELVRGAAYKDIISQAILNTIIQ